MKINKVFFCFLMSSLGFTIQSFAEAENDQQPKVYGYYLEEIQKPACLSSQYTIPMNVGSEKINVIFGRYPGYEVKPAAVSNPQNTQFEKLPLKIGNYIFQRDGFKTQIQNGATTQKPLWKVSYLEPRTEGGKSVDFRDCSDYFNSRKSLDIYAPCPDNFSEKSKTKSLEKQGKIFVKLANSEEHGLSFISKAVKNNADTNKPQADIAFHEREVIFNEYAATEETKIKSSLEIAKRDPSLGRANNISLQGALDDYAQITRSTENQKKFAESWKKFKKPAGFAEPLSFVGNVELSPVTPRKSIVCGYALEQKNLASAVRAGGVRGRDSAAKQGSTTK